MGIINKRLPKMIKKRGKKERKNGAEEKPRKRERKEKWERNK